jgi:hypothetical protein
VLGLLGLEASDVAADAGGEVSVAALEDVLAQHRRTILHDWRGYLDDGLQLLADRLAELKIVLEIDSGGDDDSAVIAVGEQWAKVRYIPNESDFDKTVVAPLNALIAGRAECRRLRCSEDWDTYAYWVLAADAWQTLDASYPQVAALFLPARAAKLRSSAKPRLAAKKKAAWTPKKHIAATREGAFEKFDAEFAKEVRDVEDWIRDPHAQTTKTAVLGFMPVVFGLRLRNMGWHLGERGCVRLLEGDTGGWSDIVRGANILYHDQRVSLRVSADWFSRKGRGEIMTDRLEWCCTFGVAYALGLPIADEQADILCDEGPPEMPYRWPVDWSPLAPLMIRVAAEHRGRTVDVSKIKVDRRCKAYDEIWKSWDDPERLGQALAGACDYRVANGPTAREKESMEFFYTHCTAMPWEVLSVLRLRRERGLPQPTVNHPLMQTLLAAPPDPPLAIESDDLLERALATVKKEFYLELDDVRSAVAKIWESEANRRWAKPPPLVVRLLGLTATDVTLDASGEAPIVMLETVLAGNHRTVLHERQGRLAGGLHSLALRLSEMGIVLSFSTTNSGETVLVVGHELPYDPKSGEFEPFVGQLNALLAGRVECRRLRCSEGQDVQAYWVLPAHAWKSLDGSFPQVASLFARLA